MIIFNQAAMLTKFLLVCGPQYEGDPIQYERREISNHYDRVLSKQFPWYKSGKIDHLYHDYTA